MLLSNADRLGTQVEEETVEINSFFGVPAHPLFVHIPVVLTPLAALTALVVLRTSWRRPLLWVTVGLAGVALIGAQFAVESGQQLEERVRESSGLEAHAQLGEATRTLIAVFFLIALAFAVYEFLRERRAIGASLGQQRIATLLTVAMILSGALATVWVIRTGHQGAKITWQDVGRES
jgi:uncharacterized membrane protein